MRPNGFAAASTRRIVSIPIVALAVQAAAARGTPPSPDVCSWITPAQLQTTFGRPFLAPIHNVRPATNPGQASGKKCDYEAAKQFPLDVVLIGYVDPTPAEAKVAFEKAAASLAVGPKPAGVGDEAYTDEAHALHVLKGNVRYSVDILSPDPDTPARDKQRRDLAIAVAAQL